MRTPLGAGKVADMATGGKEEGDKETKHAAAKQEDRFRLWQTHSSLLLHPAHAQLFSYFQEQLTKNGEQTIFIFVEKGKKPKNSKTSSKFNATNMGKYRSRKQIFED